MLLLYRAVVEYNLHMSFIRTESIVNRSVDLFPQLYHSWVLHDSILVLSRGGFSVE